MEYNQFKQLLALKGIREKETISLLEDFIQKFPYSQTARLLYVKSLHDQNNILYDQQLKLAAAYAPNREILRNLVEIKTEEVEFEFPLSRKEEPAREFVSAGIEEAIPVFQKEEMRFEESYTDDEISGRAFEEQREKEKLVDPHEVIRQRLNEILGGVNSQKSEVKSQKPNPTEEPIQIEDAITKEVIEEKIIAPEEKEKSQVTSHKSQVTNHKSQVTSHKSEIHPDPIEDSANKEILIEGTLPQKEEKEEVSFAAVNVDTKNISSEKKMEHEQAQRPPETEGEKAIKAEAGKTMDVLDKMELEHAMEESILDSLEKLPFLPENVIQPLPAKEKVLIAPSNEKISDQAASRSFTEWLKSLGTGSSGFEEVRAAKRKIQLTIQPDSVENDLDPESLLSDDELIEKFLLEDPKIGPSRSEFYSPVSQAKKSVMDHDDTVSETLAQIYLRQGNTQKARWCYEKLILLHPEKSAFFAALLKEIPEGSDDTKK
ncbi:MAG: hypothetical protein ABI763_02795 [Bacteroidota bacterium]